MGSLNPETPIFGFPKLVVIEQLVLLLLLATAKHKEELLACINHSDPNADPTSRRGFAHLVLRSMHDFLFFLLPFLFSFGRVIRSCSWETQKQDTTDTLHEHMRVAWLLLLALRAPGEQVDAYTNPMALSLLLSHVHVGYFKALDSIVFSEEGAEASLSRLARILGRSQWRADFSNTYTCIDAATTSNTTQQHCNTALAEQAYNSIVEWIKNAIAGTFLGFSFDLKVKTYTIPTPITTFQQAFFHDLTHEKISAVLTKALANLCKKVVKDVTLEGAEKSDEAAMADVEAMHREIRKNGAARILVGGGVVGFFATRGIHEGVLTLSTTPFFSLF